MAGAAAAALAAGRPRRWLRLESVDLADGCESDADFRPASRGREFFEEIIRDNLDPGRPDRVQLVFDRVVTKKTPGESRTRVIQDGVPSQPAYPVQELRFETILQGGPG